jgi:hypothetical protein
MIALYANLELVLFEVFYATGGWMATPFLYPSEISTLRLRSKGSAISVLSKWIFNFLVVMITPVAIANIGWQTYIIWAVLNCAFIFVVYFFYPETKGLTLEESDRIFEGGNAVTRGAAGFRRRRIHGHPSQSYEEKVRETSGEHVERTFEARK